MNIDKLIEFLVDLQNKNPYTYIEEIKIEDGKITYKGYTLDNVRYQEKEDLN